MTENQNLTVIDSEVICNQQVNVYGTREKPLFLAKEVSSWIGYSDTNMMCKSIDEEEKIKLFVTSDFQKRFPSSCWKPSKSSTYAGANYLFLTEFGVYEVLMQSRLPKAKEFKKGVKEILKRIRLT